MLMISFNEDINIDIEYVKLEMGELATPLSPRPYAEELAMCQRYYQVHKNPWARRISNN